MATIQKRGDKYRVFVRRTGHKTLSATFDKRAKAEKWAIEKEAEVSAGRHTRTDPDFGVLIQRYIDEILPVKPMQRSHTATLRTLRRRCSGVRLSELTPAWMLEFAKSSKVQPSTTGQLFVFLGMVLKAADAFWNYRPDLEAWRRGRYMLNQYGLIAKSNARSRRVSDDEIADILDNMQSALPMDELIQFAIDSCMRLGEVVRVVWSDLDQDKRLLTIRERKHPRKKVDQTIPLLGQAFDIAARQPRFRKEIFPYNADSISAAFHRAVVRAGIEDLRWHDLRHEGISRLFERGLSIERVALVSGHQDWAMLRRYTHLKPESLHEEEDLIGG